MKKILIVDDDKDERTVLTDILSAEGFETVTAEDGNQALGVIAPRKRRRQTRGDNRHCQHERERKPQPH